MHAINKDWGWNVHKFTNYANVGVEDLTFKGHAKEKFIHHGSDIDDGGFKLIDFVRLTNSWMRRVNFESVSEAMSINGARGCVACDSKQESSPHLTFHITAPMLCFETPQA